MMCIGKQLMARENAIHCIINTGCDQETDNYLSITLNRGHTEVSEGTEVSRSLSNKAPEIPHSTCYASYIRDDQQECFAVILISPTKAIHQNKSFRNNLAVSEKHQQRHCFPAIADQACNATPSGIQRLFCNFF